MRTKTEIGNDIRKVLEALSVCQKHDHVKRLKWRLEDLEEEFRLAGEPRT